MSRSPNSRATQSLPREAREAIKAVFDALSEWRDEVSTSTERQTVLDKMAAAARALGWPKELVDASHKHLVQASKAQMHVIDQLMDAWEKQLTAPASDQFMAQLRTLPSTSFGVMPDAMSNPLGFWMQAAETWQRNWASAPKQLTAPASDQFMASTSFGVMPDAMSNPLGFWMQAAETWQRNWALALSMWTSGSSKLH